MLLSGASLLARSLRNLETELLGFEPKPIVTVPFTLNRQRYAPPARQDALYSGLEQALARIPDISRLALSDSMPLAGGMHGRRLSNMRIAGHLELPPTGGMVAFRYATPGYFDVLGIPIVAGRDFDERERTASDTPCDPQRYFGAAYVRSGESRRATDRPGSRGPLVANSGPGW